MPAELTEGIQFDDEDSVIHDEEMYLYRKFLYNTRQLIRVNIELGDNTSVRNLMLHWDTAIGFDESNIDENLLHSTWLQIDAIMKIGRASCREKVKNKMTEVSVKKKI